MGAFSELSDETVVHMALSKERSLISARFQHSQSSLDNTSVFSQLRAEIARLHTEARSREIANSLGKGSLFQKHRGSFKVGEEPVAEAAPEKGGFLAGIVDKLTSKE